MNSKELRLAGGLLYLCEGTKLRQDLRYKNTFIYSIEFTNSNPKLVNLFIKFMIKELKIDIKKIKGQLYLLGTFKVRYSNKEKFLELQEIMDNIWRDARVV